MNDWNVDRAITRAIDLADALDEGAELFLMEAANDDAADEDDEEADEDDEDQDDLDVQVA